MSGAGKEISDRAARRQLFVSYAIYMTLFAVLFIIAVKLVLNDRVSGLWLYAVVSVPGVPLLGMFYALRRFLLKVDEMRTRLLVPALLKGLAALLLIIVPWGFMSVLVSALPRVNTYMLFMVFLLVFIFSFLWENWKVGALSKTKDYDPWKEPNA